MPIAGRDGPNYRMTHNPDNPDEHIDAIKRAIRDGFPRMDAKPACRCPPGQCLGNPEKLVHSYCKAPKPVQADLATPVTLTWRQSDRWHLISDDGHYTVAKAQVLGVASYSAWYRPTASGRDIPHHLGEHPSSGLAKATAQQHHVVRRMGS